MLNTVQEPQIGLSWRFRMLKDIDTEGEMVWSHCMVEAGMQVNTLFDS
jgi:hypothetical protein